MASESPDPPKKEESSKEEDTPTSKAEPSESKTESPTKQESSELSPGDRIFATPVAKKIALERGIPLSKVKGSGPNGRIIREDVEKFEPPSAATAGTTSYLPPAQSPDYTDIPLTNMRRTIGSRLTQAKQEMPHYYLTAEINMGKTLKLREVFNKALVEKDKAAKLSVNDFIVKAVACALADVPEANTAWLGEVIRQ